MTTLGDLWNADCTYEQKADWLALNLTRNYLEQNLDAGALAWWNWFRQHGNNLEFLRLFFHSYAHVFGQSTIKWVCRNPSACAVATMKALM